MEGKIVEGKRKKRGGERGLLSNRWRLLGIVVVGLGVFFLKFIGFDFGYMLNVLS